MMDHFILNIFLVGLMIEVVHGLGGGCLVDGLGEEYSPEATALRYQERIYIGSGSVQAVHLSLAGPNQMMVTWLNPVAFNNGSFKPYCRFGPSGTNTTFMVTGKSYSYPDGGFELTLNRALLDLETLAKTTVYYKCGDDGFGVSPIYNFTLQSKTITKSQNRLKFQSQDGVIDPSDPLIALIGDHATKNGGATSSGLADHVKTDNLKLLLHIGDISYADHYGHGHNNSYVWVSYMNMLQDTTAFIPYMTTPGNHERQFKFAAYLNWLAHSMPTTGSGSDFWYSFDYLGVHFVAFSTEHAFYPNSTQHQWMEKDLIEANTNRKNSPWIIVFGHRPLYCTSVVCEERCLKEAPVFRSYLEDLLYKQRVDVVFHGHNHQYERSYPVYKLKAVQKDYMNPKAPVYIVNGAAGNPELNDPTFRKKVDWRAFDDPTFETGYVLMQPTPTELRFQYINSNKKKVIDQFVITKTQ